MKGMKRAVCLFIFFSLCIIMLGCRSNGGGNDGGVHEEWDKFYRLDLDGAKAVVRWPATIGNNQVGKLFKVTNDNELVEVDPLDSQGNKVNIHFMPMNLCNASPDYLMAWVSNDRGGNATGVYLISKADGRIYPIPPEAGYPADYLRGPNRNRGQTVQFDPEGNLYYITRSGRLVRLTVGSRVTATFISDKYDREICHFWVDKNGNIMYNFEYPTYFRLINPAGVTIRTFTDKYEDNKTAFNVFLADGEFYIAGGISSPGEWVIDKITIDGDKVELTEYNRGPDPEGLIAGDFKFAYHAVNLDGHVFYIYYFKFYEVYNPNSKEDMPRYFVLYEDLFSRGGDFYDYDHTGKELYFIGADKVNPDMRKIVRFRVETGTIDEYWITSAYHVTDPLGNEKSFIALGNGELLFEATRKSDDRRVLLLVDSSGSHEIAVMDPKYGDTGICFERVPFHVD